MLENSLLPSLLPLFHFLLDRVRGNQVRASSEVPQLKLERIFDIFKGSQGSRMRKTISNEGCRGGDDGVHS